MIRRYSNKTIQSFVEFGVLPGFLDIFSEFLPLLRVGKRFYFHNFIISKRIFKSYEGQHAAGWNGTFLKTG